MKRPNGIRPKQICSECHKEFPATLVYFTKHKSGKYGLRKICKKCCILITQKYRNTPKGKSVERKATRKYYLNHPERKKNSSRKWRQTIIGHLHIVFDGLLRRCTDPKTKDYKYYGGRGIQNKFESADAFINYVLTKLRIDPRGFEIDRINNNGHYEQGNIRFVTHKENCNNRENRRDKKGKYRK